MDRVFGGTASPAGWVVAFLQAPKHRVLDEFAKWLPGEFVISGNELSFPAALELLEPFSVPATRELVVECADGWTALLSNHALGGDPTAPAPYLGTVLGVRCVVADHAPLHGPGHGGTQLWVSGPNGVPPLMYERTVGAVCQDGRWSWRVSGDPLPCEDMSRYESRRIRDRFDRAALLGCLAKLGIRATDDTFYGSANTVDRRRHGNEIFRTRAEALQWLGVRP